MKHRPLADEVVHCDAFDVATDQTDIIEFTVGQRGQGVACDTCVVPFDDAADNVAKMREKAVNSCGGAVGGWGIIVNSHWSHP